MMVYLLSRTAKLLADLNDNGVVLSEKKPEAIPLQADDEDGSIDGDALISLDTIEQISNMSSGKTAELWTTAQTLLEDIERWLRLLSREKTEHERVHLGNLAYANMMKVSSSR
jgi:TusA-related sulfurtransferase